jgi:hypothetical protein
MNHSVRDSADAFRRFLERFDGSRRAVGCNERELEARRAGVDDEDVRQ